MNYYKNIFKICVISIGCLILLLASSSCFALQLNKNQIDDILNTNEILGIPEQNRLLNIIDRINPDVHNVEDLQYFSTKIKSKVDKDVVHLTELNKQLNLFLKYKVTRTIGQMRLLELNEFDDDLRNLNRDIRKARFGNNKYKRFKRAEDYIKEIELNSAFLIKGRQANTIPEVWLTVMRRVRPYYLEWNRRFTQLRREAEKEDKDIYADGDALPYQELKFTKRFGRIQTLLRRLSKRNSPDF